MKIELGYTSMQFGQWLNQMSWNEFSSRLNLDVIKSDCAIDSIKYHKRLAWDEFLMQPLKKEMFINEASKDWFNEDKSIKIEVQLKYFEAEKRVIFKDVEIQTRNYHEYDVFIQKKFIARIRADKSWAYLNTNIGDLFTATNGELNLQNVNI